MSAPSHPTTAKAIRCESCGAALPPDNPICLYCGSQHNLPAWPAEHRAGPEPAKGKLGVMVAAGLVLLVVIAWWLFL